ncbi:MAG: MFS transporter [Erythrobacter sp.]|jgi:GPH family glycoside/pentoside/hexuronide:cation symporter
MSTGTTGAGGHRGHGRLALFAFGDFAFNLYWQSAMLYLLFYYTEALHLSLRAAAACYAIASVWDGIANLLVGVVMDRYAQPERFRPILIFGSVPLGAAFTLAYVPPPVAGTWMIAWVIAGHLLFRTAYALVNIPYLAMSARISVNSADRAFVAAGRMLSGTLAAIIVAVGTVPLGRAVSGGEGASAYGLAALCFAVVGSGLLLVVGLTYRDAGTIPQSERIASVPRAMIAALGNRAFVMLCAASIAMTIAVTVLDKSVLYYFKYVEGNQTAGQQTLGWMMAISAGAIPFWMMMSRRAGIRSIWLIAVGACAGCIAIFVLGELRSVTSVRLFLVAIQGSIVGLHFAYWALLPDTIEYGQRQTGIRAEAAHFGLAALIQRVAIGIGTLMVGLNLGADGLHHASAGDPGYRLLLAFVPLSFFVLTGLLVLAIPLRRGSHALILAELAEEQQTRAISGRMESSGDPESHGKRKMA